MQCNRCNRTYYKHGVCLEHYISFRKSIFNIKPKDRLIHISTQIDNRLGKAHHLYFNNRKESDKLYCELDALIFFKKEVEIYLLAQERYNN